MRESSVDWEKAVTELVQKWERLTRGNKPIFINIFTCWKRDLQPRQYVYICCSQINKHYYKYFENRNDSLKWVAELIHDMLDEEFRRQYAEQERAEIAESEEACQ